MSGAGHDAPRYSEAQVALFEVLGLVPWVRREDRSVRPSNAPIAVVADASSLTITSRPLPVPAELADLGNWLAMQPLAAFARRGEQRHETGPDASPVLVVAEAALASVSLLPLEEREAELLGLMMRAIDLPPGDWSTAVLADPARGGVRTGIEGAPLVGQRLDTRRAALWLARESHEGEELDVQRFAIDGVPAFRVPHPAVLLEHPLFKRRAWQGLKALRNLLADV